VLSLLDGAHVAEYLGHNPWGHLDLYVREVHDPLHGVPHRAVGDERSGAVLVIPADDVAVLNGVLDGFYECYSGGSPWRALSDEERAAVERLAAQLPQP
jgi:hypothetical protein